MNSFLHALSDPTTHKMVLQFIDMTNEKQLASPTIAESTLFVKMDVSE